MSNEPGFGLFDTDSEISSDADQSFIEVINKNKNKRKKNNDTTKVNDNKKLGSQLFSSDNEPDICKHFLANRCRHGFSGQNQSNGIKSCPFRHPKACWKWMANGNLDNGYQLGKDCDWIHPMICSSSLKDRTCRFLGTDSKCRRGYHIRGTKPVADQPAQKKPDPPVILGLLLKLVGHQ